MGSGGQPMSCDPRGNLNRYAKNLTKNEPDTARVCVNESFVVAVQCSGPDNKFC